MKEDFDQYIVTKDHLTKNFYKKMDQFLFTTGIIRHLQLKYILFKKKSEYTPKTLVICLIKEN